MVGQEGHSQPAPNDVLKLVGLDAVTRRLAQQVLLGQDVAGRQRTRRYQLLAHLVDRRPLGGVAALLRRAERVAGPSQAGDQLGKLRWLQRESVVAASGLTVEREGVLDHPGA